LVLLRQLKIRSIWKEKEMIRITFPLVITVAIFGLLSCSSGKVDQAKHSEAGTSPTESTTSEVVLFDNLGGHHHPITTDSDLAQRYFDQGLIFTYGFNHSEAERAFMEAARLDPECAMCHWGAALALGPNINALMEDEAVAKAYDRVQKAVELSSRVSAKEQAYIQALSKRYGPEPLKDRTLLDVAYANAMREVASSFPDDSDAATLFGEALMVLHPWAYWQEDGEPQPWTSEILTVLEVALKIDPNNPGANHLYLHAVEASPNPERGLASADRLRDLVPGIGHMVHMPSHIYIRTGHYHEGSLANERAIKSDQAFAAKTRALGLYPILYMPHNYHFLVATASMEGRSEKAIRVAHNMSTHTDQKMMREPGFGTLQHFWMTPLYVYIRFGKWDEILAEPAPLEDLIYPTGVYHYARGMAFIRKGRLQEAQEELNGLSLIASDPALRRVTIWDINTTWSLMQIANQVLAGELAAKRGDYDRAISHLERGVRLEEELNYDEPPPWLIPVRHCLGAVLLEAGRPAAAEKVYRQDLNHYPENGWSLYGLHQSLVAQGKTEAAADAKRRGEIAWARADVTLSASRF
jgi:tetratricopeptide (TPR) repeat protein